MQKKFFFYIMSVFLIIITFSYKCSAEDTIKWFHANFPPAFILQGSEKGTGYCDKMEKDVSNYLTEYKHRFYESNYKRIVKSLHDGMHICCASIYKTPEREKFSAYSEPLFIGLSNGIIIPSEKISLYEKYITPEKSLDLQNLLKQEKNIKLGVIAGRNYGTSLENAISAFRKTKTIDERSGNDSKGLLKKLLRKRVNMILALPMEISYAAKQTGIKHNALIFFPIKDGKQFTTSYMACPGNKWGREVIKKINPIIIKQRPLFAKYYRDWLDNSGAELYEKLVKEVFGFQIPE